MAAFVAFDPKGGEWQPLPDLPEPRSSHDAVVIGDRLFVAGGWQLGPEEAVWHKTEFYSFRFSELRRSAENAFN